MNYTSKAPDLSACDAREEMNEGMSRAAEAMRQAIEALEQVRSDAFTERRRMYQLQKDAEYKVQTNPHGMRHHDATMELARVKAHCKLCTDKLHATDQLLRNLEDCQWEALTK